MNSFDLLRAFTPDQSGSSVVAVGETGTRTVADLLYDVACVGAKLPAGDGEVLVTCQDRYYLAVTLLAAWRAGRVVALPPNAREQTLSELAAHCTFALHDGAGPGQNMMAWLHTRTAHAAEHAMPAIPAQQHIVTIYTSGSTGAPAPCRKSATQLLGEGETLQRTFHLSRESCVLATVPAHHIYGMLFSILLPMAAGARFVRETPLLTPVIEDSARRYQANVLVSVPAHLRVLSESQLTSLASVRRIFSSGAPLADATAHELHRRFQVGVYEILGSTETGGFAHRRADADGARFRPFAGVTITSDDDQALGLRSPLLDPSVSQPLVCPDRIELNADGSFRHLGRIDGVVKVGGTRVSLAELETRVRALDGVLDVTALAVDGTRARGQEIWLVIASERGQELPELRAHLLRYYEPVLLPRRVRFIDALPREATGKLMRARLLELFRSPKAESTVP
jgi:4-coumarate--CoA ligase (photoactive yellow protein activation family)